MKIIITGSSGFLGSSICSFLECKGHELTKLSSSNCDLRHEDSLNLFSHDKYDIILHLAAWTQAGDFCIHHPGEQWIINQKINTNVLDWWHRVQPQAKLVFMGTSCAYSPDSDLRESSYMLGEPIEALYTYAMTKRMLYQGAVALHKQFNLNYLCTVPSTLYGGGYHLDGRQMHFIFDLIRKIIRGKEYGDDVILWGNGYQKRELVLVTDYVKILWNLIENHNNDIVNIGAGREYTIREFAESICDIVGYSHENIQYDEDKYVGAESKCLNIDKMKLLTDDNNITPLKDGLEQTVKWFYQSQAYNA